jgi:hypothetical protein
MSKLSIWLSVMRIGALIVFLMCVAALFCVNYLDYRYSPRIPKMATGETNLRYTNGYTPIYVTDADYFFNRVVLPTATAATFVLVWVITWCEGASLKEPDVPTQRQNERSSIRNGLPISMAALIALVTLLYCVFLRVVGHY